MSKSVFQCWVGSCEENDIFLYPLQVSDSRPETGIYMAFNNVHSNNTKKKFMQNWNYYYGSPVYHVWIDGKCISATRSYSSAIEQFLNAVGGGT